MNTIKRLEQFLKPYFPHIVIAFAAIFFGCGVGYMKVSTRPPEGDGADETERRRPGLEHGGVRPPARIKLGP